MHRLDEGKRGEIAPRKGPGRGVAADGAGGIAWWAHIGGFIAGIFLVKYLHTGRQAVALVPMGFSTTPFRWFR